MTSLRRLRLTGRSWHLYARALEHRWETFISFRSPEVNPNDSPPIILPQRRPGLDGRRARNRLFVNARRTGHAMASSSCRGPFETFDWHWRVRTSTGHLSRRRSAGLSLPQDDTNIWRAPGPLSTSPGIEATRLVASTREENSPQFSRDGSNVFVSDRSGSREVWMCDSDGLNPVQLTNFGGSHTGHHAGHRTAGSSSSIRGLQG